MSIMKPIIVTGLVGLIAACSVDNCGDASQDGLATALNCTINPGGYQAQTDALAAELSQKQTLAADLRAENARLRGTLNALDGEAQQATSRLITVNTQMAALDDQLNAQLRQQSISQAEFDLAQSQLSDLNNRRSNLNPANAADARRIEGLEAEIADLQNLF